MHRLRKRTLTKAADGPFPTGTTAYSSPAGELAPLPPSCRAECSHVRVTASAGIREGGTQECSPGVRSQNVSGNGCLTTLPSSGGRCFDVSGVGVRDGECRPVSALDHRRGGCAAGNTCWPASGCWRAASWWQPAGVGGVDLRRGVAGNAGRVSSHPSYAAIARMRQREELGRIL